MSRIITGFTVFVAHPCYKFISISKFGALFSKNPRCGPALVWLCHNRGLNNRIKQLHERALRNLYQDENSNFETLLEKDKSVNVQMKNLHCLVTENFKDKNDISLDIMRDIFIFQENYNYNLRSSIHLAWINVRITLLDTETVSNGGAKIWLFCQTN